MVSDPITVLPETGFAHGQITNLTEQPVSITYDMMAMTLVIPGLDLSMPIVAIGAAFDFHANILPQAPPTLQNFGLEWLYRLIQEPTRLWKRYIFLNPLYVALIMLQASKLIKFDSRPASMPQEMRYG